MEQTGSSSSLLSYLDSDNKNFYFDIPLISEDSAVLEEADFPFFVINDKDPLARIVEARLQTDAGSEIDRVFLLVQRDSYRLVTDELWPVENRQIEGFWRKAFSFYASRLQDHDFVLISALII